MKLKLYLLFGFLLFQTTLFSQQATHLNFDGVNDDIVLPATIGNALSNGTELTIEYWFKGTNVQSAVRIQGVSSNWIVAGWGASNDPLFLVSTDGGVNGVSCGPSAADNTWHHLAFVWKRGTTFATYVDGVLVNSRVAANVNLPFFSGVTGRIGSYNSGAEYMNGNIDDVRIWNVAKTATQINASKNCELQGTETGLLAYYKFNQGNDAADNSAITTLIDATSNSNNGTFANFTLTGSTSNFLAGSPVTTGLVVPGNATVTTPVVYPNEGDTATPLTATVGTNGTGLVWYTTATGGTGSTTAPTPSTATSGNTSYWVSSINANGCESDRVEIVVQVNPSSISVCWAKISSGHGNHTLAIKLDGTLWAWGDNTYGQLGDGTTIDKSIPTQIGTDTNWSEISAGENHSLALKSNGTLWAWGYNFYGQLGDGTTVDKNIPTQIATGFSTSTSWTIISAGGNHSLALYGFKAYRWGSNQYGQLGMGTTVSVQPNPEVINPRGTFNFVAAGRNHSMAGVIGQTRLLVFGLNSNGQLGIGSTTNINNTSTQVVSFPNNMSAVSLGGNHSLVTLNDGSLWAFGENTNGQLGDGTTTDKLVPTRIGTDLNWASISAGGNHSLARKADNSLWSWGYNNSGQLGDGTNTNKITPTQLDTNTNWSVISAGGSKSLAIKSGELMAWGDNTLGQLGDGTNLSKNLPIEIGCSTVLSSDDFIAENNVTIYPNPSNGIFTIDAKEAVTVEVYDMIGKKVFNSKIALGSSNLDLSNHANGIYLLMVTNQNGNVGNYKLIKQ
ncbi:MAG: LamG-like jellyroll fold domain-containing protein [Flavobacterium sp.]